MDNLTMLPMDWKPLREAATAEACKLNRAMYGGAVGVGLIVPLEAAMRVCLADLTRPASRDFWARWLAEKVGLTVGATAPEWRRFRMALPNGTESWAWALLGKPGEQFFFTDGNAPGISTLTDPAAALRAALLAVEPA